MFRIPHICRDNYTAFWCLQDMYANTIRSQHQHSGHLNSSLAQYSFHLVWPFCCVMGSEPVFCPKALWHLSESEAAGTFSPMRTVEFLKKKTFFLKINLWIIEQGLGLGDAWGNLPVANVNIRAFHHIWRACWYRIWSPLGVYRTMNASLLPRKGVTTEFNCLNVTGIYACLWVVYSWSVNHLLYNIQ